MKIKRAELREKYVNYFEALKANEGEHIDFRATAKVFGVSNNLHQYAKRFGLIEYDGSKLIKVRSAYPSVIGRFINYYQQENHAPTGRVNVWAPKTSTIRREIAKFTIGENAKPGDVFKILLVRK